LLMEYLYFKVKNFRVRYILFCRNEQILPRYKPHIVNVKQLLKEIIIVFVTSKSSNLIRNVSMIRRFGTTLMNSMVLNSNPSAHHHFSHFWKVMCDINTNHWQKLCPIFDNKLHYLFHMGQIPRCIAVTLRYSDDLRA